jgi:hypothetical protein
MSPCIYNHLNYVTLFLQGKKGLDGPQGPDGPDGPEGPDGNKVRRKEEGQRLCRTITIFIHMSLEKCVEDLQLYWVLYLMWLQLILVHSRRPRQL